MTIITFTPEKQSLISDFLNTQCGGRKWNQVKAKIQDKAERYADEIIAKNTAIIASKEQAEALRQERLAMPAQRHYDGIPMEAPPVIKTATPIAVYKSMFAKDTFVLVNNFAHVLGGVATAMAYTANRNYGKATPTPEQCKQVTIYAADDLQELFNGMKGKKESVDNDLVIIRKIHGIYARVECALINHDCYDTLVDAYYDKLSKKLDGANKFKRIVNWTLKNLSSLSDNDERMTHAKKMLDEVGHDIVKSLMGHTTSESVNSK